MVYEMAAALANILTVTSGDREPDEGVAFPQNIPFSDSNFT